jgi:nitroimidazol reductase NimA-like FMN-containing flavoprotein (pyridoxamine 5'-phosphate oxidase superfamily)
MGDYKNLSAREIDRFLKNNQHGILSLAGSKPYALPMGYMYRRKTILMGLAASGGMVTAGRKMDCLKKSKNICFTICTPRWHVEKLKEPCTTLVIEGRLEEVKDGSYYGIKKLPAKLDLKLYKIHVAQMGARKCNRKPCELLAAKKKK